MSDAVAIALIVAIGSIVTSIIGVVGIVLAQRTHHLINSRMDELLAAARALARAEGVAVGEQSQRDRES